MKKIVSVLLVMFMLFSVSSCKNDNNNGIDDPDGKDFYIKNTVLAICENDVLNPYSAKTKYNRYISSLLTDSLFNISESFDVVPCIASGYQISGKTCTVTLNDVTFTDGTKLTADDVIYSLNYAKESSSKYAERFKSIESFTKKSSDTVVFTMTKCDELFALLLDFPIIKNNTGDLHDSRNITLPPVGTGPYVYQKESSTLKFYQSYFGQKPYRETIYLINSPDDEALRYNVTNGRITSWYESGDLTEAIIVSGSTNSVTSNDLVYIGMNIQSYRLSSVEMRYALAVGIDRESICDTVYQNFAVSANGIFNPNWSKASTSQTISNKAETNILVAYLNGMGYNRKDANGIYLSSGNAKLSFELLYCSDNTAKVILAEELKEQYRKAGIDIVLKGVDKNTYLNTLASGKFELYLGETVLLNNMDLTELLSEGGSLAYGIKYTDSANAEEVKDNGEDTTEEAEQSAETDDNVEIYLTMTDVIKGFYSGDASIEDVINTFNLEMPIIPICYKNSILSYNTGISSPSKYYFDKPYNPAIYNQ